MRKRTPKYTPERTLLPYATLFRSKIMDKNNEENQEDQNQNQIEELKNNEEEKEYNDEKEQQKNKRRSKMDNNGRDFTCGCGKCYLSYPALYIHIKTKHGSVTPTGTNVPLYSTMRTPGRPRKVILYSILGSCN